MILHQKKKKKKTKKKKKKVHVHQQFQSRHCLSHLSLQVHCSIHLVRHIYSHLDSHHDLNHRLPKHILLSSWQEKLSLSTLFLCRSKKCAGVHFLKLSVERWRILVAMFFVLLDMRKRCSVSLSSVSVDDNSWQRGSECVTVLSICTLYMYLCTIILTNVYTFLSLFTDTDVYTHVTFL